MVTGGPVTWKRLPLPSSSFISQDRGLSPSGRASQAAPPPGRSPA
jgi:hypothetical protein